MKVFLNLTEKILFILGFCLFIINIIGLFISLRNESIYKERAGINLTEKELYHRINEPVTDKKEYIANLNEAVHKGIAHYWRDAGINKYNLRIPFYENYLKTLALLGTIYEKKEGYVVRSEQGARGYRIKRFRAEHIFYLLKWVIPCILIMASIFLFLLEEEI